MGGKYGKRRHPCQLYLAGIILTVIFFSGCTAQDMQHRKQPNHVRLQRYLINRDKQISEHAFQEAAKTNTRVLGILKAPKPSPPSDPMLLRQAQGIKVLLNQILTDRAQKKGLEEQILKNKKQLEQNAVSIESLKTLIKNRNQTIQTLENQKKQIEKQIERMKQIDLK